MNDPLNQNYDYLVTENDTKNDTELTEKKHSKCGVISFILSIFLFIAYFLLVFLAAHFANQGSHTPEQSITVGFIFTALIFINIISFILGLIGSIQSTRKRLFGIIGLIFSLAMLAIVISLFLWAAKLVGVM